MADPDYYKVTVNSVFTYANQDFRPGVTYWVNSAVYNGSLTDSSKFSDRCATAVPHSGGQ
jgi:hypothetical protein